MLGISIGFLVQLLAVGLGLGAALTAFPALHTGLKIAGGAYLLYLAWKIAMSRSLAGKGDERVEALRLADAFRASVIDANTEHFIFEITGKSTKVDQFIAIMKPLGLVEICRTGVAAMNRGPQGM